MKSETRYIVTDVVSVPVCRIGGKGEAYRYATGAGWGVVDWYGEVTEKDCIGKTVTRMVPVNRDRSDKTQKMFCDEDTSAVLYPKYGVEFVISSLEEINLKEAPKQAATDAIVISTCAGFDFWENERGAVKIFVTYDENGLIDTYRLDSWNGKPEDGETEIAFEDLQGEEEYWSVDRADIPGTLEFARKAEAAAEPSVEPEEKKEETMKEYKGMYQRNLELNIAAGAPSLFINWLNMSEREAMSGGADRCTELLLAAGYRPDGSVVREELRARYERGLRGEDGKFIRVPQETWTKGGAEVC